MKDLILLLADKSAKFALDGVLSRPESLGIREIEYDFIVHAGRDGGARKTGPDLLALKLSLYRHSLLILDYEGCGTDKPNSVALEYELDTRLNREWNGNAKSIVIEPELDVWAWGSDYALESALQWPPGVHVREWLMRNQFSIGGNGKPDRPKEALEAILREINVPRSAALYKKIAEKISLARCGDLAFVRLRDQLRNWFPKEISMHG